MLHTTNICTWRSRWPRGIRRGLQPLAIWNCRFEFRKGHICQSFVCAVCCQVGGSATGVSLVEISMFLNRKVAFQISFANYSEWAAKQWTRWIYYTCLLSLQYTFFIPLHVAFFTLVFICDSWCRKHGHKPSLVRSSDTFRTAAVLINGMQWISSLACRVLLKLLHALNPQGL